MREVERGDGGDVATTTVGGSPSVERGRTREHGPDGAPHLLVERQGPVEVVTFHRPDALNAFTFTMAADLRDELARIAGDPAVRAVVLTGAGRAFSSGADLKDDPRERPLVASGRRDLGSALRDFYNPMVQTIRQMPQPVVTAVNGVAAGVGCSIALAGDLVVAARSASFMLAFAWVALVPDGGSSVLVSARAGIGRALEMALTGDPVDAETALRWNLVTRVEDDGQALPVALELAARLAAGPPEALAAIKRLIDEAWLDVLPRQLVREADAQTGRSDSDEVVEAISAFRERRAPAF